MIFLRWRCDDFCDEQNVETSSSTCQLRLEQSKAEFSKLKDNLETATKDLHRADERAPGTETAGRSKAQSSLDIVKADSADWINRVKEEGVGGVGEVPSQVVTMSQITSDAKISGKDLYNGAKKVNKSMWLG